MRRETIRNPAIPLDLLTHLAATTRLRLSLLPRIATATEAELRSLAESATAQLRMLVAARQDLPHDVVNRLAADDDPRVVKRIIPHPAVTAEQLWTLVRRHGSRVFPRAARNPNCPPDLLQHLLPDEQARAHVARHPNLSPQSIVELLDDPELGAVAAANPSLPVAAMEQLLRQASKRWRDASM